MRARAWLITSGALNLVLAVAWFSWYLKTKPAASPPAITNSSLDTASPQIKTNVVVRRHRFTWHEVESEDYATYIKNLRRIQCPEETIRDVIVAEVNQLFNQRRNAEILKSSFQWWRSEPDPAETRRVAEAFRNLEAERRELLARLLGPNWNKGNEVSSPSNRTGVQLEGPVLGSLSPEAKQKVYGLSLEAVQRQDAYLQIQREQGKQADSAEMARMRREFRDELSQHLNAEQLEEFLLRYSQTAMDMRREFRGLDLTPDEFRTIFRTRDPIEQQAAILSQQDDPLLARRLLALQSQTDEAIKRSVGTERYTMYKLNQDPLFRETKTTAEKVGASPEIMFSMYEINQETEAERERVRNDLDLSSEEKIDALAVIQAEQQKSLEKLLGQEAFQRLGEIQGSR